MNILDNILQNITYVLFPLTLYLIYFAYIKNMDLEEKSIFLEIALFSSLYMLFRNIDRSLSYLSYNLHYSFHHDKNYLTFFE